MPDKSASSDHFAKAANGKTAGSYFRDGRFNLGGWWTYPSADALAISSASRTPAADPKKTSK